MQLLVGTTNRVNSPRFADPLRTFQSTLFANDLRRWPEIVRGWRRLSRERSQEGADVGENLGGGGSKWTAPGIYSARYVGQEWNQRKNNEKLLRVLTFRGKNALRALFVLWRCVHRNFK